MTSKASASGTNATCHCGAVTISLAARPAEVTECNCSLCRSYGVVWYYCDASELTISPDSSPTETYAWNGRNVDFHRCRSCGCITHWLPRDPARAKRGINARLLPPQVLASAKLRHLDGAGTGEYCD